MTNDVYAMARGIPSGGMIPLGVGGPTTFGQGIGSRPEKRFQHDMAMGDHGPHMHQGHRGMGNGMLPGMF
jgi:hypothetical protein